MTMEQAEVILEKAIMLTNKEWADIIEKKFKEISKSVVDEFYADYSERKYKPYRNLYQSYHVKRGKQDSYIILSLDSKEMDEHYKRGMTAEKIYNLTMIEGWHGGAKYGDFTRLKNGTVIDTPHPNPGVPYWRTPAPFYTQWGEMAAKMWYSPEEKIIKEVNKINFKKIQLDLLRKYIIELM